MLNKVPQNLYQFAEKRSRFSGKLPRRGFFLCEWMVIIITIIIMIVIMKINFINVSLKYFKK